MSEVKHIIVGHDDMEKKIYIYMVESDVSLSDVNR